MNTTNPHLAYLKSINPKTVINFHPDKPEIVNRREAKKAIEIAIGDSYHIVLERHNKLCWLVGDIIAAIETFKK